MPRSVRSDSLQSSSTGTLFVRRGMTCPYLEAEPQPQIDSVPICGIRLINSIGIHTFVQSAFRILSLDPGGFFISGESSLLNSIRIKK